MKMIFDIGIWSRLFIIFTIEIILIIFCFILAFKTIRKRIDHASIALFFFYIFESGSFIINLIYFPLRDNIFIEILYRIAIFLNLYSLTFLLMFLLFLYKGKLWFSTFKQLIFMICYLVILGILLCLPKTIIVNEIYHVL